MRPSLLTACALFVALPVHAEDLPPERVAELRHKQKKAEQEVEAKHGNKKPKDMSKSEFEAVQGEKMKARQALLDKEGVNAKDYDRSQMKQNKAERSATEAKIKDLEKKDAEETAAKAKAEAEKKAAAEQPAQIPIQRGFNEQHPVELENKGGEPVVEKGIPEDVQRDIEEARAQGTQETGPDGEKKEELKAPAKGKKK